MVSSQLREKIEEYHKSGSLTNQGFCWVHQENQLLLNGDSSKTVNKSKNKEGKKTNFLEKKKKLEEANASKKKIDCSICKKKISGKYNLKKHIENMHQIIKCKQCDYKSKKSEMKTHYSTFHCQKKKER